jgi:type VI secretion system secreted protein VgrG
VIEDLLTQLVERLDSTYYGKYRGYVHDVNDPDGRGRIRAIVPRLLGAQTPTGWALPSAPYAGPDQGFFSVPDVGSGVWIEFEEGDLHRPIWCGQWWGAPLSDEIGTEHSTAPTPSPRPTGTGAGQRFAETPQHDYPRETPTPRVRIWKSSSGHHVVMDDRPESERLEIHDSQGNRIILSPEGMDRIMSNERVLNKGARSVEVDGDDDLEIAGRSKEVVGGSHEREVKGDASLVYRGNFSEKVGRSAFVRTVDEQGTTVHVGGALNESVSGGASRSVSGAVSETAVGGFGVSAGGGINLSSAGTVKIAAGLPDLSLKAISIDALAGNVSVNTMLGLLQLGGLSATSPAVLGDGLAIHLAMLAQILKAVNPLTVAAYGPALDLWAAMTPALDLSYFAFLKRYPVG